MSHIVLIFLNIIKFFSLCFSYFTFIKFSETIGHFWQPTIPAPMPQQAGTARMLNTAEPTIVPTPMSPSVMNVPMAFTNNSGADVAAAINVAPATSFDIESAEIQRQFRFIFNFLHTYIFFVRNANH